MKLKCVSTIAATLVLLAACAHAQIYDTNGVVITKPEPGGGLTNAVTSLNSIRGPIVTSWTNNVATTNYTLNVTIPANATASIYIPSTNLLNITESGGPVTNAVGLLAPPLITGGATVFQVGAGLYQFKASGVTF